MLNGHTKQSVTPKTTVVVDLDGTLANVDHRLHLVRRERPDFEAFYTRHYRDKINGWCLSLIKGCVQIGLRVLIVSARPISDFQSTAEWLLKNGVPNDHVTLHLLRGEDDFTPDHELKRAWLRTGEIDPDEIAFVVDDRKRVVDMWREEGLVCLQCYAWEEFNAKEN